MQSISQIFFPSLRIFTQTTNNLVLLDLLEFQNNTNLKIKSEVRQNSSRFIYLHFARSYSDKPINSPNLRSTSFKAQDFLYIFSHGLITLKGDPFNLVNVGFFWVLTPADRINDRERGATRNSKLATG